NNIGLWIGYLWGQVSGFLLGADDAGQKFLVMVVAIALFVAVMGVDLYLVDRPRRVPTCLVVTAFPGPSVLFIAFGLVYPAIRTMITSLQTRVDGETVFIGLDNYVRAFTQSEFQIVLRNTALWVILVPTLATAIGLVYAVLVDRTRFERIAKTLMFLPM